MKTIVIIEFKTKNKNHVTEKIFDELDKIKNDFDLDEFVLIKSSTYMYSSYDKLDLNDIVTKIKLIPGYQSVIRNIYFNNNIKKV